MSWDQGPPAPSPERHGGMADLGRSAFMPPGAHVDPDLREQIVGVVRAGGPGAPSPELGHLLGVLEDRLRSTQAALVELQRSYSNLLAQLYPPNEVYVVARAV